VVVRRLTFLLGLSIVGFAYLFGRITPSLRDEKMKPIMYRLFSLFFPRAIRSKVISFPRSSRFPRWQEVNDE
jgi:hypothetical protein